MPLPRYSIISLTIAQLLNARHDWETEKLPDAVIVNLPCGSQAVVQWRRSEKLHALRESAAEEILNSARQPRPSSPRGTGLRDSA